MAEYLNRIGAGLILLDAAPLSYDWVPPNVVGREDEQGQLASMFASIGTPGVSCRAVTVSYTHLTLPTICSV